MTRIVAVANQKGGVGKTTTTYILLGILVVFLHGIAFSDDFAYGGGTSVNIFPLQNNEVQLKEEFIFIKYDTLHTNKTNVREDWYNVEVIFTFVNYGPPETLDLAFPDPAQEENFSDGFGPRRLKKKKFITDFRVLVDDSIYPTTVKSLKKNPELPSIPDYKRVYTWRVFFDSLSTTEIKNTYKMSNNWYSLGDKSISYILKTGALWKGTIDLISIDLSFFRPVFVTYKSKFITNEDLMQPGNPVFDSKTGDIHSFRTWGIGAGFENVEPNEDFQIDYIDDEFGRWRYRGKYLFTDKELETKSLEQLRYLRNEIFAQYGYLFKDDKLNALYNKYQSNPTVPAIEAYNDSLLSDLDRVNLEKIKRFENRLTDK